MQTYLKKVAYIHFFWRTFILAEYGVFWQDSGMGKKDYTWTEAGMVCNPTIGFWNLFNRNSVSYQKWYVPKLGF